MAEKNRKQVINLHSADDKMPVSQLSLGEIGVVHTNTTDAKLYVETNENTPTSGTLATFITENAINNKISSVYSVIGDVVDNLISVVEGDGAVTVTLTGKDDQNSGTTLSVKHKTVSGLSDGFDKVSVDGFGHVTGTTAVTINDITGLSGFNDAVTTAMQTKVDELSGATIAVEDKVDELSGAVETTFVASVEYNKEYNTGSASQPTIIFYDKKGQVIDTIDATDFIKDGMVDGVAIVDNGGVKSLVIDFNTDSGKQDVSIPLTDFFDPSLYYTKTEINTLSGEIETKIESLSSATETIESNLNTLSGSVEDLSASTVAIENDLKALSGAVETNYYTKTEIDGKELVINGKITDLSASTKSINDTLTAHISDTDIHVTATEKSTWNAKQDAISDLETIRNNALSGASAYTDMLTGVTMNGSPATVTNKVANIGTVVTGITLNGTAQTVTDGAVELTVTTDHAKHKIDVTNDTPTQNDTNSITYVETLAGAATATDGENLPLTATRKTIDNVVTDANYVHTDNNYTTDEKTKLGTIEASAQTNVIETVKVNGTTLTVTDKAVDVTVPTKTSDLTNDSDFVSDASYVHTDANYTEAEKTKLAGIEAGAEVNVNADWDATSGDAQILNKPTNVSVFTNDAGYITDNNDYFDGAVYDSTTKRINFKHSGNTIAYVDATNFIKDGMVDSVTVDTASGGTHSGETCLIITFNEDAGAKEDIYIPLSDIFDPSNYYTKTEVDAISGQLNTKIETLSGSVVELSASTVTIESNLNTLSGSVVELSGVTQTIETNLNTLSGSVESLSSATQTIETNLNTLSGSVEDLSASTVAIESNLDTLSGSVIELSASTVAIESGLTELSGSVIELSASTVAIESGLTELSGSVIENYYTKEKISEKELVVAESLNDLNNRIKEISAKTSNDYYTKSEIDTMANDYLSKEEMSIKEEIISESLNDLNDRIIELSGQTVEVDLSNYYTKSEVDNKDDNLREELYEEIRNIDLSDYYTKSESDATFLSISSYTEDEMAISAAFNYLNDRTNTLSAATDDIYDKIDILSGKTVDLSEYYTKSEVNAISGTLETEITAHTSDATVHVTTAERELWNGKQNNISDLETIRNNASSGASAYESMLTGITVNGTPVTVTNKVAAISADTNVIETVKVNGTALTVTDKAVDITVPSVEPYFDGAEYNSTDKKIYFKHGATIITSATIDATDFIKDGMVDSVTVDTASGGTHSGETCLIITFNEGVEGQKEDIYIPLTSIFDPSNYYNKTDVDAISGQLNTKIETLSGSVVDLSASTVVVKNDLAALSGVVETDYYDKDDIDGLLGDFVPVSAYVKDEKVIAAAFNEINTRVNELSGNSSTSTDAITALQSSVNNNTADIVDLTDDLSDLSASTMAMETAVGNAITAITMNGTAQTKTNNAVDLGTVLTPSDIITSEAALSGVSTTGSVVDATVVNTILANLIERTEYEDDLYVVAKAFNDLNDRLNAIESRLSSLENDVNVLQGGNY